MSTPPKTIALARQQSTGRVVAPGDVGESTHVRRLPKGPRADQPAARSSHPGAIEADDEHDTIPCRPPVVEIPTRPNDLERTLRFARLVRDTLADDHPLTRLLELALLRRDAALLQGL